MTDSVNKQPAIGAGQLSLARRQLGRVDPSFYIIGVGASAGGLDAIKQLISPTDENFPHSFVIIQHISPDHKSLMSEILGRETRLTVAEVVDDMPVEPGFIYLIPPKTNVVIQGTLDDTQPETDNVSSTDVGLRFSLVAQTPRPQLNLPIDVFFHSLAEAVGERAIAIVLSGTGTDGSRGLRAVKDMDGFVMVQDPSTANFDGMPNAAISTNLVDLVAAPDAMVGELTRFIGLRETGIFNIDDLFLGADRDFHGLLEKISEIAEIDFTQYKDPTLKRRIARRIALNQFETFADYLRFVEDNPSELKVLHREFLVGVTNFFRDMPAWKELEQHVIPALFNGGEDTDPVKVWSVGCSTGEEAYTIAFLLEAYRTAHGITRDFRIFASDVNEDAIRSAKDGVYPDSVIEEIPSEFRNRQFLSFHGGTFHIKNTIRNRVIFNSHNVLQEPPYINTDLIICRNLLIYLGGEMQKRVLSLFSFSLRDKGYLFLGAAENVAHPSGKFESVVSGARIYRNLRPMQRGQMRAMVDPVRGGTSFPLPRLRRLATRETSRSGRSMGPILEQMLGNVDGCLLILDEGGTLLETVGDYRQFIELPDQAFSANVFDLLHERLKSAVSLLLRQAETNGRSQALGTKCAFGDRIEVIDLYCQRIEWETQPTAFSVMIRRTDEIRSPAQTAVDAASAATADQSTILRLEGEIESLREMLTVTTEDLGVSNEELQTANEELTVSNEELQANNEEMQSINEELHTVNAENADKIVQLEAAQADIENLLNTADLAVIFLDSELRIRRFNPAFRRYIDLKDGDIGRPITTFSSNLLPESFSKLISEIEAMDAEAKEVQHEIGLKDGSWSLARIRPFTGRVDLEYNGVAITILDISQSRKLQDEVRQQRDRLERLIESEAAGYWDWDLVTNDEFLSPRFKEMLGYQDHEMENRPESWQAIIHPDDLELALSNFEKHVATKGEHPFDQEVRYTHKAGHEIWVVCRGHVVDWSDSGEPLRMIGVHIDITDIKQRELRLRADADLAMEVSQNSLDRVREPLQALSTGFAEIGAAFESGDGSQAQETLGQMTNLVAQVQDRVGNFANFIDVLNNDLTITRIELEDLIDAIREEEPLRSSDVEFFVHEVPAVWGQPDMIRLLFTNLFVASLNSGPDKGPCEISVTGRHGVDRSTIIQISDNGRGIVPEEKTHAFELFFQTSDPKSYLSDGLAIPIAKRIVDRHRGTMKFLNHPNQGTRVEIVLPRGKKD